MLSLTRVFQVGCDPESFYRVLMDQESYPEFVSEFKKVKIWKRQGEEIWADCEARFFKTVHFTLHSSGEPFHRVRWRELKGAFQFNEGGWLLKPLAGGLTEVTYYINLEKRVYIPNLVVHWAIKLALPKFLANFKHRAELLFKEGPEAQGARIKKALLS